MVKTFTVFRSADRCCRLDPCWYERQSRLHVPLGNTSSYVIRVELFDRHTIENQTLDLSDKFSTLPLYDVVRLHRRISNSPFGVLDSLLSVLSYVTLIVCNWVQYFAKSVRTIQFFWDSQTLKPSWPRKDGNPSRNTRSFLSWQFLSVILWFPEGCFRKLL